MSSSLTRSSRALAALAAATTFGMLAASAQAALPAYYPSGPQTQVARTAVTSTSGWTMCWDGAYGGDADVTGILADCDGAYLMLAAAPTTTAPAFTVLAAGPREAVTKVTGYNETFDAHGTAWYRNGSSWGFAPAGEPIQQGSADVTDSRYDGNPGGPTAALRLSWHGGDPVLFGGWRAGRDIELNSDSTYRRYIFESNGGGAAAKRCSAERATYNAAIEERQAKHATYVARRTDHREARAAFYAQRPRGSSSAVTSTAADLKTARDAFVDAKLVAATARNARLACLAAR